MIRVTISKSTGKVIHEVDDKQTLVTGLPPNASVKAIEARIRAMNLRER